jgi:glycerol-3-phosphate dehydrogenase
MKRDPSTMTERVFDVVVVGGGIFGIAVAREAAHRGLDVALLEREDFTGAASSNSFRMVHGGIRYLQHGDLVRLRLSSRERTILLRTSPHLVHPLPILIPTYGHMTEGKPFLRSGMLAYDLLTMDRNRGIESPERRIPWSWSVSRDEVLSRFPSVPEMGLTGGCVFADAQMHHPSRLGIAMLRAATREGARTSNYAEVTGFLRDGDRVAGVEVRDRLSDDRFQVRAHHVVNCTGAWAETLLRQGIGMELEPTCTFSRDLCFVVARRPSQRWGLAVLGQTRDPDAVVSRSRRHLFMVPWRDRTLVGVWHSVRSESPDRLTIRESEVKEALDEINESHPGLELSRDEVELCNAGLVLFGQNEPGAVHLSYGKRSRMVDHEKDHGVPGLWTLIGVRYTTARADGEELVDRIVHRTGKGDGRGATRTAPVFGGDFHSLAGLTREAQGALPPDVGAEIGEALARNYGSEFRRVLAFGRERSELLKPLSGTRVLGAEVVHAVREEMARHLADVVLRRTDLGITHRPSEAALEVASTIMAGELGWSSRVREAEVRRVQRHYYPSPEGTCSSEAATA